MAVTPDGRFVLNQAPYHNSGHTSPEEDEETIDLLKLLWFFVHHRWLIAGFISAGLIAGVLITFMQTPLYRATAKVEIISNGAKVFQDLEIMGQNSGFRTLETEREKMLSRDLARRVVFDLNLAQDADFLAPTPSFSLMNLLHRATGSTPAAKLGDATATERESMAVEKVRDGLNVKLVPSTSILSVAYSHPKPIYAAEIANQIVRSYIDQNTDKTSETSDLAHQFIEEQVRETKAKLQTSEKALVEYAKSAGITVTGNDASLISQNISELNQALSNAIQQRLAAKSYYDQVQAGDAASLPGVFESRSIQETKQKIAGLKAIYQEKLKTFKPGFPEMRQLQAQINELEHQVDLEIGSIAKSAEIVYAQAQEKIRALRRELAELESEQSEFQDKNIQYTILKREVESNRTQYESLIEKLNDVGVGSELKTTNASVIDPAVIPRAPYSPRLTINLTLALALSGALAAAIVCLIELLNNTFAVPDELQTELRLPVLGILPTPVQGTPKTAFDDNHSALSEAFRSLRTSLQFTGLETSNNTLLVTSAEQGEGKSTTAYKLANDFAALGKKVLVIDADLRSPQQHRLFGTNNTVGLSNLLSNVVQKGEAGTIFHKTGNPLVTLLTAGTIPPNPVELLVSPKMTHVLNHCAGHYDLVIIDGPPVAGLSDAPVLSRQADATLLIVWANKVTRKSAKMALSRLQAAGGNVVGAALNKFTVDRLDYSYAYRYMQYNYYGYGGEAAGIESHASSGQGKRIFRRTLDYIFSALPARLRRRTA